MFSDNGIYATLPCSDFERAKAFYKEKLGLTPSEENPGGSMYDMGDNSRFLLFPSGGKASGDHTQAGFRVQDIESTVADLRSRGVEFQEYDTPQLKTENGIARTGPARAAWFKDSEGNVLGVIQFD